MWGEIERSPVLTAPSFNDYVGLTATSTNSIVGEKDEETQAANDLCDRYRPLALKIAGDYRDRGIHFEDLRSAAYLGLVSASRKFDPARGAFGPYAKPWIKGEITRLFKPNADAMGFGRSESLKIPARGDDDDSDRQRDVAAPAPTIMPDLSALAETDRYIIQSRLCGETLAKIGNVLGLSPERVRQREARARSKIKGIIASECISDLTKRGEATRLPGEHTRREVDFRDREPPRHAYWEPKPSRKILHHRANASRLADLRGNKPLRNPRGPYGGPVIHGWGRP
jgi:RNA polymerase sigma factor (sigma-70 family)